MINTTIYTCICLLHPTNNFTLAVQKQQRWIQTLQSAYQTKGLSSVQDLSLLMHLLLMHHHHHYHLFLGVMRQWDIDVV